MHYRCMYIVMACIAMPIAAISPDKTIGHNSIFPVDNSEEPDLDLFTNVAHSSTVPRRKSHQENTTPQRATIATTSNHRYNTRAANGKRCNRAIYTDIEAVIFSSDDDEESFTGLPTTHNKKQKISTTNTRRKKHHQPVTHFTHSNYTIKEHPNAQYTEYIFDSPKETPRYNFTCQKDVEVQGCFTAYCPYPNCNETRTSKSNHQSCRNMNRHLNMGHLEQSWFGCDACEAFYSTDPTAIRDHYKYHCPRRK